MGNYFNIFRKEEPEKAPDDAECKSADGGVQIEVVCTCFDCRFMDVNRKCRFRKIVLDSAGCCASYEPQK